MIELLSVFEGIEVHGGVRRAFVLKQGKEVTPVAQVCRNAGISQATHFNWKKRHGGWLPDEMHWNEAQAPWVRARRRMRTQGSRRSLPT